jgi:serine/threonine protein kinase
MKTVEDLCLRKCTVHCFGVVEGPLTTTLFPDLNTSMSDNNEDKEAVGVVMSLCRGGSLDALLHPTATQPKKLLELFDKLQLLLRISIGLAQLHVVGVVHGDIKPQNILLDTHTPPEVFFSDFGLTTIQEKRSEIAESTLNQTRNTKGTPLYCSPEQLVNPFDESFCETVAAPSKKTDMYSFGIMAWEILTRTKPFQDIKSEATLCAKVHQGHRPSVAAISKDVPAVVVSMVESCWDKERSQRKLAVECYAILNNVVNVYLKGRYDIFFSHAWVDKPFLSHVYYMLVRRGYRVWYDQNDMGFDLHESMKDGIANSNVVLVCCNRTYQTRKNCMFELAEAKKHISLPIVAVGLEIEPMSEWANAELMSAFLDSTTVNASSCELNSETFNLDSSGNGGDASESVATISSKLMETNYVHFGEVASLDWTGSVDPDESMLTALSLQMDALYIKLESVGCKPSM